MIEINGRLGLGDEDDRYTPQKVEIQGKKTICFVSAGTDGSFFLTKDGKALACGSNEYNQLGFNTLTAGLRKRQVKVCYDIPFKIVPMLVRPLTRYNIVSISLGKTHSAAITATGKLITFGDNKYGQLGVGNLKPRSGVCEVKGLLSGLNVVKANCGDSFTVIATRDNLIYSFGHSDSGRLGLAAEIQSLSHKKKANPTPRPIFGALHRVSDLSCTNWHTIIIVERVLKSRTIKNAKVDSVRGSIGLSQVSQSDDSVFESFDDNSSKMSRGNSSDNLLGDDDDTFSEKDDISQSSNSAAPDGSTIDSSVGGPDMTGGTQLPPWLVDLGRFISIQLKKDEEMHHMFERIRQLELENKQLHLKLSDHDDKISTLQAQIALLLKRDRDV
ncbi:putative serine/threonine-protein kinase Nek9 [Apostichopus japonicus]|uniref:non-specific serine/threonine protein kinase n=1 Tax=Stichopus japonicus TaxID=307972 RepID=A0A2G8L9Z8_STIJA|nr:putative serine/threonine-protein kinase Nek9 [Apostichopus japonicus]